MQGHPGLNRSSQGTEQGKEDGSHAARATLAKPNKVKDSAQDEVFISDR